MILLKDDGSYKRRVFPLGFRQGIIILQQNDALPIASNDVIDSPLHRIRS